MLPPGLPIRSILDQVQARGGTDRRDIRLGDHRYALLTVAESDTVVQAVYTLDELYAERQRVLIALGVAGGIGVLLATLLAARLARRAVLADGRGVGPQRRFVADAGHELRTPLTLLSTRSEPLRRRLTAPATEHADRRDRDRLIINDADGIVDDALALTAILDELFMAADTRVSAPTEKVDASSLVREAVAGAQATAQQRGLTLCVLSPAEVKIQAAGRSPWKRAVTALVDNALAHATSRVDVRVVVRRSGGDPGQRRRSRDRRRDDAAVVRALLESSNPRRLGPDPALRTWPGPGQRDRSQSWRRSRRSQRGSARARSGAVPAAADLARHTLTPSTWPGRPRPRRPEQLQGSVRTAFPIDPRSNREPRPHRHHHRCSGRHHPGDHHLAATQPLSGHVCRPLNEEGTIASAVPRRGSDGFSVSVKSGLWSAIDTILVQNVFLPLLTGLLTAAVILQLITSGAIFSAFQQRNPRAIHE